MLVSMKTEEAREKEKELRRNTRISKLKRRSLCSATVEWKRGLCDGEQLLSPPLRRGWGDLMLQLLSFEVRTHYFLVLIVILFIMEKKESGERERESKSSRIERARFLCMLLLIY